MRLPILLLLLFCFSSAWSQSPSQVQVSLRTFTEDQWQFTGNFELGQTLLRGRRGEPGIQVLLSSAESQQRLDHAAENFKTPEVALNAFQIRIHAEGLRLNWTVASADPLKAFRVERKSKDGRWKALATLPAPALRGMSDFEFIDRDPWQGQSAYRLRQEKTSGKTAYSATVVTGRFDEGFFSVFSFPDPVLFGASVFLELRRPTRLKIHLLDAGKNQIGSIYSALTSIGAHEIDLNLDQLPRGSYYCRIEAGAFISGEIPLF